MSPRLAALAFFGFAEMRDASGEALMLKVGDAAPSFRLKDHEGRDVSLEALRGKRFVLWFYPKADTPGCTMEGCGFRDLKPELDAKGVLVFGASYDTEAENAAFVKKFSFNFPLLCDVDRSLGKNYGALDPQDPDYPRRITYVIGPEGKVEKAWETVKPKFHPKDVLKAL